MALPLWRECSMRHKRAAAFQVRCFSVSLKQKMQQCATVQPAICALACVCLALAPAMAVAQEQNPGAERVSELSIEDLMKVDVVTASRVEEKLTRAASVMSVVTAREIERAGFRTIYDVLARVPGFFPSTQATWKLVGTRGLVADGNDHILLLIDGHPQNSIVAHGFQQQDQIPRSRRSSASKSFAGRAPFSGERAPRTRSSTWSPRTNWTDARGSKSPAVTAAATGCGR
jgi:hypothetical protein